MYAKEFSRVFLYLKNSLATATNSDQMKAMAGVAGFNKLRTLKNGIEDAMKGSAQNSDHIGR